MHGEPCARSEEHHLHSVAREFRVARLVIGTFYRGFLVLFQQCAGPRALRRLPARPPPVPSVATSLLPTGVSLSLSGSA